MPQKLPPLGCLTGSLGPNVERYAKPLEKLCDSLDPLLQGKSMDALGLSNHELNERVVTMKDQLHCLETTFNDQLRTQQEARTSEAKSFQMARAAYLEKLEMLKQTSIESPKESAGEQRARLNLRIAKLTEQLEHRAHEEKKVKAELESLKAALATADGRNEMLSSKLEAQVKQHQSLEEKFQASQRELDATTKRFASAREAHQAKLRKVMEEAKESQFRAEHWEAQAKRAHVQEGETWKSTQELWILKEEIGRLKQDLDHARGFRESGATSAEQLRNDLQASMDTQCLLQAELDKMKAELEERSPKKVPNYVSSDLKAKQSMQTPLESSHTSAHFREDHMSSFTLPEFEDHKKLKAEKAVQTTALPGDYYKVEAASRTVPTQEQTQNLRSSSAAASTEKPVQRQLFPGEHVKKEDASRGFSQNELDKILKEAEQLAEEPGGIEQIWDKLHGKIGAETWSKIGKELEEYRNKHVWPVEGAGCSESSSRGLSQEELDKMCKADSKPAKKSSGTYEKIQGGAETQSKTQSKTQSQTGKELERHNNMHGRLVEQHGCSEPSSRGFSQEELDNMCKAAEKLAEEPGGIEQVWEKLQGELDEETWSKIGNELGKHKNRHGRLVEQHGCSEPSSRGLSQEELDKMCTAAEKLSEEPSGIEDVWDILQGELGAETWSKIGTELEKHKDRMASLAYTDGSREEVDSYKCTADSSDSREWRIGKRHKEYRMRRQLERIRQELEKHENRHGQHVDEDGWSDGSPLGSEFLDSFGSSGFLREELDKMSDSYKCENIEKTDDLGDSREWRIGKRHSEYRKRRQLEKMAGERGGDSGEEKRFEKVLEILENVLEILTREL